MRATCADQEAALHLRSLAGFLRDVELTPTERRILAWDDGPLVTLDGWQAAHATRLERLADALDPQPASP